MRTSLLLKPKLILARTQVNRGKEKGGPEWIQSSGPPSLGRVESLLLRDRATHQGNRPEPAGHQRQGGGQGHPCADTTAVGQLLHRSAARGASGSARRGACGCAGRGARGGGRPTRGVVLHQRHLQAVGVDGAHREGAVDPSVGESGVGERQDGLVCAGRVDVEGVGQPLMPLCPDLTRIL